MIDLSTAPKRNMRYHEMVRWLTDNGISVFDIRRWVNKELIEQHFVEGSRRAYYNAAQIRKALDGNRLKENGT